MPRKPKPPKQPNLDNHKELVAFLSDATSRPFGMVLFYSEAGKPDGIVAANVYKHEEDHPTSMMMVGASHALYQVADTYDAEEIAELLAERGVLTFLTETKGNA